MSERELPILDAGACSKPTIPKPDRLLIGTIGKGKDEKELWLDGQALEKYRKMNKKDRDKFAEETLHKLFYRFKDVEIQ